MPLPNEPPTQVSFISATDSNSALEREVVKVVTTAGPQCVDKDFLTQLLTRKDVIPARKRRDFIPNNMKDDHYWERRRKNNLAAKRSREKRRLNDIVLGKVLLRHLIPPLLRILVIETKVVELSNENETLKAKLNLMLSRLNMKEIDMETLFEEEQRLGRICLKPATSVSTLFGHHDDDEHSTTFKDYSSSETHDEDEPNPRLHQPISHKQSNGTNNDNAVDLSRTEVKRGNLLTTIPSKSPSPLTPSPSPSNESLLQVLANQMLHGKHQETITSSRLLTIASPTDQPALKRNLNQLRQEDEQQQKWDEAAMTLLSLNKPSPAPVEQQAALQSVINGLLRKPNPPKATIDYHSHANSQQMQGENFHHQNSFEQWKTLMNYFSMPPTQQASAHPAHSQQPQHESRGDMMPLKLRMKMLNAKS